MGITDFPGPGKRNSRHRDDAVDADHDAELMDGPLQPESEMGDRDRPKGAGKSGSPRMRRRRKRRKRKRRHQTAVNIIAQSLNPSSGLGEGPVSPMKIIAHGVSPDTHTPAVRQNRVAPEQASAPPQSKTDQCSRPEADQYLQETDPFWEVWLEHRDYLRRLTIRLMENNMEDVEDVLSHAMIKASQKYDDCANTLRAPLAWLTTIVHNVCLDHHRSFKTRKAWVSESMFDQAAEPIWTANAAPEPSPEEHVSMRQRIENLEDQLLRLPSSLRDPLLMRVMEEKTYTEIARQLNVSENTARKRIQRARDRLRRVK